MSGMNYFSVYFGVIEYVEWNYLYAAIVDTAFLLIGLLLAKIVAFLKQKEASHHDGRL
jgi:hypothetical protein